MAVDYCYECYDELLFDKLGQCLNYMIKREQYDLDQSDKPFTCIYCEREVNPRDY